MRIIYVNSSTKTLNSNAQQDAENMISDFNEKFKDQDGHAHIKFYLKEVEEVVDDTFHNTSCSRLGTAGSNYGRTDAFVMLLVNDLSGSCAGVSFLWVFPDDKYSITMVEYKHRLGIAAVHELTHSFLMHHTGNEYTNSVPGTGLKEFDYWISKGGRSSKRCNSGAKYYISPDRRTTNETIQGVVHDPFNNTMYPSFGGQTKTQTFFNSPGYHYSFSWGFDCWFQNNTQW